MPLKGKLNVFVGAVALLSAAAPSSVNSLTITPDWAKRPQADEMASVYPASARSRQIEGTVLLNCAVTPAGSMTDCRVVREAPTNEGFADSALRLSKLFVLRNPPPASEHPARMLLPIRFSLPSSGR